jgi:chorismate synthase
MSSTWGNLLEISIFGESHGPGIGVVINGLPSGHKLDL